MQWRNGARSRRIEKQGHELVSETESFLRGSIAELFDRPTGGGVPLWAWTNALAHGTVDDLRRAMSDSADGSLSPQWHRARSFLAAEVLAVADSPGSLEQVQATALVPLELRLALGNAQVSMGPAQWVAVVLSELSSYQENSHPSP